MKVISLFILLASCSAYKPKNTHPIQGPLEERHESYRQCYLESDSYQSKADHSKVKIVVSFKILESGKVEDERILETPFKDPNLNACLLEQIRKTPFEAREFQAQAVHPFSFIPRKTE